MPRRRGLDEVERKVLRTLEQAVSEGEGWKRGGVRGWLLGVGLNAVAGSPIASLDLPRLRLLGWVAGEAVKDPGRRRGLVLWRITQDGAAALAAAEKRAAVPIPPPTPDPADDLVIYVNANAWACLAFLNTHHPQWVRWSEVVAEIRTRFRTWVYGSDMLILIARGLAEREDEPPEDGMRKVIWYRSTRRGSATTLLERKDGDDWVQLRLPGEREDG